MAAAGRSPKPTLYDAAVRFASRAISAIGGSFIHYATSVGAQQSATDVNSRMERLEGFEKMELTPNWEYVADRVMGGVSDGRMYHEIYNGHMATVLRGNVSLDNNGGFIQIAFDLRSDGAGLDASGWDGIAFETCGNNERYDVRFRTEKLTRPWQSFRTDFVAKSQWRSHKVPFETLESHKTDARFDPAHLRRIGILAIGREFQADVAIAGMRLYRFA